MDYYSSIAESYDELYGEEQRKKIELILHHYPNLVTENVLDVGCGTASYVSLFKRYTGIDDAKNMLKHPNCVLGEAEHLPFPDHSFDVVMSITAIHNFKDTEKAIQEMKRVSKGKIIISVLKRSQKFKEIQQGIQKYFKVKIIEEEKDIIFITQ